MSSKGIMRRKRIVIRLFIALIIVSAAALIFLYFYIVSEPTIEALNKLSLPAGVDIKIKASAR